LVEFWRLSAGPDFTVPTLVVGLPIDVLFVEVGGVQVRSWVGAPELWRGCEMPVTVPLREPDGFDGVTVVAGLGVVVVFGRPGPPTVAAVLRFGERVRDWSVSLRVAALWPVVGWACVP